MILNTAKNELRRAVSNSSTDEGRHRGLNKITQLLLQNDFPPKVISKCKSEVMLPKAKQTQEMRKDLTYLKIPYVNEQHCRKVFFILRSNKLLNKTRVIFTPGDKLKDTLCSTKIHPTKCNGQKDKCYLCDNSNCMRKNVCYKLECNLCGDAYIGETKRHFRVRMREHYNGAISHSDKTSAMGGHYKEMHPEVTPVEPFSHQILQSCSDHVDRLLYQSVLIKNHRPQINVQLNNNNDEEKWNKTTWGLL